VKLPEEDHLRGLYEAGDIDAAELERRLDRAADREAARRRSSERASAPLTDTERVNAMARIADSGLRASEPLPRCKTCNSELRSVRENGVETMWCAGCSRYVGPDPRHGAAPSSAGAIVVGGVIVETGPDLDHDGDVDGGIIDSLRDLFG
jgi:hypothetical protein